MHSIPHMYVLIFCFYFWDITILFGSDLPLLYSYFSIMSIGILGFCYYAWFLRILW